MTEYITPYRIANAILQNTAFQGTYFLVEGNNDYILFRKFVDNYLCEVQTAFGKQNILEAIELLNEYGHTKTIGVLDSDFRNLDQNIESVNSVFYTDNHDLETMIIESETFNVLVDTYCDLDKTNSFIAENNDESLKTILCKLIAPFGYLKWANTKEDWGLLFKPQKLDAPELKIENFIPVSSLKFTGYDDMIHSVFNYSRGKVKARILENSAITYVKNLSNTNVDHYQLCNGHDLCYLFALGLRKKLASYNAKAISVEQIETSLVHGYDSRHFQDTQLYRQIKGWEAENNVQVLTF